MDEKDREYVLTIARERSFSRAAELLYVSQPSLSAYIIKMEERIGCKLFDRSTSPVALTDAGKAFVDCAQQIKELETGLATYLADLANLNAGQLTVGGSNFYCSCFLPPVVSEFARRYPGVRLTLVEDNFPNLLHQLAHGAVDCVVDYMPDESTNFTMCLLKQERILLAVPQACPQNRALEKQRLTIADVAAGRHLREDWPRVPLSLFAQEDFLFLNSEHNLYSLGLNLCKNAGFRPKIKMYLNQILTSYALSLAGHGVSFISDTVVQFGNFARSPVLYAIDDPLSCRHSSLIRKKNHYVSKALQEFTLLLREFTGGPAQADI